MSQPPLLYFHMMADPTLNPGAVELCVGEGDLNALLSLVESDTFADFCARFTCFFRSELAELCPEELRQALEMKGIRLLHAHQAQRSDEQTKPALSSTRIDNVPSDFSALIAILPGSIICETPCLMASSTMGWSVKVGRR